MQDAGILREPDGNVKRKWPSLIFLRVSARLTQLTIIHSLDGRREEWAMKYLLVIFYDFFSDVASDPYPVPNTYLPV